MYRKSDKRISPWLGGLGEGGHWLRILGVVGVCGDHSLTADIQNMYWESGRSRKISEAPPTTRTPRGGGNIF